MAALSPPINSLPKSLAAAFAERQDWYSNRSSAIFPVRLRQGCDLILAYLNYWTIKNKIASPVYRVVRLYDQDGQLCGRSSEMVEGAGAECSMRALFSIIENFDGMVELEFIATANLRFAFPAVQGFYRAGDAISSVHSAGRIKNTDEPHTASAYSPETNWICKFESGITPFFHLFRNGICAAPLDAHVDVMTPDNTVFLSKRLKGILGGPFSSRMVFADEVFPELWSSHPPPVGSYLRVQMPQSGIFPRMVVGNLHRSNDFLEVTHSFAEQHTQDFVQVPLGVELASFMPALKPEVLDLTLYSFPTNSASRVAATVRSQKMDETTLQATSESAIWTTGGIASELQTFEVEKNIFFKSFDMRDDKIPSRLNVSHRFSVSGAASSYSTDISTGAKSCAYPPKHSHWGSSVIGGGFKTVLLARNMSHVPASTRDSKGTLKIWFGADNSSSRSIEIAAEAGAFWTIEDDLLASGVSEPTVIHWLTNFDQPSVEMFWVSYCDDGRICGDHAF